MAYKAAASIAYTMACFIILFFAAMHREAVIAVFGYSICHQTVICLFQLFSRSFLKALSSCTLPGPATQPPSHAIPSDKVLRKLTSF